MATTGTTTGPSPPSPAMKPPSTHVAKKPRLDAPTTSAPATDKKKPQLHPTGETPCVVRGNTKRGLTLFFFDQCENELAFKAFVDMDQDGNLWSMQGDNLALACPKFLCKFLRKCVAAGNPMVTFWEEGGGLQNDVHTGIWDAMKDEADDNDEAEDNDDEAEDDDDEELDDDTFAKELHDLVDKLADQYKAFDLCDKASPQSFDAMIHVHRID